jgi:hypothetical protein
MYIETASYEATYACQGCHEPSDETVIEQEVTETVTKEGGSALKRIAAQGRFLTASVPLAYDLTFKGKAATETRPDGSTIDRLNGGIAAKNDDETFGVSGNGGAYRETRPDGKTTTGGSIEIEVTVKR